MNERLRFGRLVTSIGDRTFSVNFNTTSKNLSGGNRLDIKEYPNSNQNLIQNLGNSTESITIKFRLINKNGDYINDYVDFLTIARTGTIDKYYDTFYGYINNVSITSWSLDEGEANINYISGSMTLSIPSSSNYLKPRERAPGFNFINDILNLSNDVMQFGDDLFLTVSETIAANNPANAISSLLSAGLLGYTSILDSVSLIRGAIQSIARIPSDTANGIRNALDKTNSVIASVSSVDRLIGLATITASMRAAFRNTSIKDPIIIKRNINPENAMVEELVENHIITTHAMSYLESSSDTNDDATIDFKLTMVNSLIDRYESSTLENDLYKDILENLYTMRNNFLDNGRSQTSSEIRLEVDNGYNALTFFYENDLNVEDLVTFMQNNNVDIYNMTAGTYKV